MRDAGSPSSSLDGHVKDNRAAREAHKKQKNGSSKRKGSAYSPDAQTANKKADLQPRVNRVHQQGTGMLQEQMDSMASMNRTSAEAANQRAIDQRGFQYDMLVYQAAVKERYCRQKMQAAQNAEISKSNDQALKYAELTNTLPPPMRQAVWGDFPEPVRPQPPISGLQQAAAAAAAAAGAQASDRAAAAPTPYTVMPQGRQLAFTEMLDV